MAVVVESGSKTTPELARCLLNASQGVKYLRVQNKATKAVCAEYREFDAYRAYQRWNEEKKLESNKGNEMVEVVVYSDDELLMQQAAERLLHQRDVVRDTLVKLDSLAGVWGDEGVFRRCRDQLRELL